MNKQSGFHAVWYPGLSTGQTRLEDIRLKDLTSATEYKFEQVQAASAHNLLCKCIKLHCMSNQTPCLHCYDCHYFFETSQSAICKNNEKKQ